MPFVRHSLVPSFFFFLFFLLFLSKRATVLLRDSVGSSGKKRNGKYIYNKR